MLLHIPFLSICGTHCLYKEANSASCRSHKSLKVLAAVFAHSRNQQYKSSPTAMQNYLKASPPSLTALSAHPAFTETTYTLSSSSALRQLQLRQAPE